MNQIEDYIIVKNTIPKELCKQLIDECNNDPNVRWIKHQWNNYTTGEYTSEPTKELDVMACTKEQQNKMTPALFQALDEYQKICAWEGDKTGSQWLSKFSPIRFNKYEVGTMMRRHYDHIHSIFDGEKGSPRDIVVVNAALRVLGNIMGYFVQLRDNCEQGGKTQIRDNWKLMKEKRLRVFLF